MENQSRDITCETNKTKHKLGFLDNDLRTEAKYLHTQDLTCVCMHRVCMCKVV